MSLCPDISNERGEKHIAKTQVNHLAKFAVKAALFATYKPYICITVDAVAMYQGFNHQNQTRTIVAITSNL